MKGERENQDYKLYFDVSNGKAKVDLVKNIVAIANSGGGKIIFGRSETEIVGVEQDVVNALDSAKLDDFIYKFTQPVRVQLGHNIEKLSNGKYLVEITIESVKYPIVFSKQGSWSNMTSNEREVFFEGDIWVRHSSKTEKVTYEDIREIIERGRQEEREKLLSQIQRIATLPEDSELIVVQDGKPISTPKGFLESQIQLRGINKSLVIEPFYLLWLFKHRNQFELKNEEISLLIASALRRSATLYWWVLEVDDNPSLIKDELFVTLEASDRDKSDAAKNILDLASIYLSDEDLQKIIERYKRSRYAHFQEEAKNWQGRKARLEKIMRGLNFNIDSKNIFEFTVIELQELADKLVDEISDGERSSHISRNLTAVIRAIWAKKSVYFNRTLEKYGLLEI